MLKWRFLENGVLEDPHPHSQDSSDWGFFFCKSVVMLAVNFLCVAIWEVWEELRSTSPPPSQKKTQKHTHMKPEPAAAGGKTPLCRKKPNPTNGRSSKVETQCCRYDHLNLWLRTRSGCYDSGRTTTCDRYTWCGCGNGIYLRSRRKVVEGWRYFGQKSDGIWVWIVLVIE